MTLKQEPAVIFTNCRLSLGLIKGIEEIGKILYPEIFNMNGSGVHGSEIRRLSLKDS
jgi:hypothetical protein